MSGADLVRAAFDRVRRAPGDLWPDFTPASTPLLVSDGNDTHLSGAVPEEPGWLPQGQDWRWPGRHPALVASTAVTLPGGVVAAGVLLPGGVDDADALAAILVHEAFHVYQLAHDSPAWEADELAAVAAPAPAAETLHAHAEEAQALGRALAAPDWQAEARRALAWRAVWTARRPAWLTRYIRGIESVEGLAEYVELRFAGRFPELDGARAARLPTRERAYHSGSALALLLHRSGPGWEQGLLAGRPLDALLAERLGRADKRPAPDPALERAARDAAGEHAARLTELERAFSALPGPRLTLAGAGWRRLGFDPSNVAVLPGERLLHTRYLKAGCGAAELEVVGAQVLAHGPDPLAPTRLEVAGLSAEAQPAQGGDSWTLEAGAVRVRAPLAEVCAVADGWQLGG